MSTDLHPSCPLGACLFRSDQRSTPPLLLEELGACPDPNINCELNESGSEKDLSPFDKDCAWNAMRDVIRVKLSRFSAPDLVEELLHEIFLRLRKPRKKHSEAIQNRSAYLRRMAELKALAYIKLRVRFHQRHHPISEQEVEIPAQIPSEDIRVALSVIDNHLDLWGKHCRYVWKARLQGKQFSEMVSSKMTRDQVRYAWHLICEHAPPLLAKHGLDDTLFED